LAACAKVAAEAANGGTCGSACLPLPDTKTVYMLAQIWTYSTPDLAKVAGMPVGGGIDSCVGAVAVALGECQQSANVESIDTGGCGNAQSVQGTAGGLWQASGPLITEDWTMAGKPTVDGRVYQCDEYAADIQTTCTAEVTSCDGFGPAGSDARSPVCQARIAFAHVASSGGCAHPSGAETVPLCLRTPYNQHSGRAYLDLQADYDHEYAAGNAGLPCWADALCVTGAWGAGSWPGPSPANGQTNTFGHYYKSCGPPTPGPPWVPFDGNPRVGTAARSDWTPTNTGNCATVGSAPLDLAMDCAFSSTAWTKPAMWCTCGYPDWPSCAIILTYLYTSFMTIYFVLILIYMYILYLPLYVHIHHLMTTYFVLI